MREQRYTVGGRTGAKIVRSLCGDKTRTGIGGYEDVRFELKWDTRVLRSFLIACVRGQPGAFIRNIFNYSATSLRGMSYWHDLVDWVGGYPFEVAKPEEIFDFFKSKHYVLEKLTTCAGGIGCNQFVFSKSANAA